MKVNQLKVGAILSYLSLFLNNIIGILYTPIMLRLLGQSEYGIYSLSASVIGYLTLLDLGFSNAIVRFTTEYHNKGNKEKEYRLYGMFLIIYLILGIIAGIVGFILYLNVDVLFATSLSPKEIYKTKSVMFILLINIVLTFPLSIFSSIIVAHEKFVFQKSLIIIKNILNPCIMLPLLLNGYASIAMVTVSSLLNVLILIINLLYCFKKLKIKLIFGGIKFKLLKEISTYSFFILLTVIVDKVYLSTGQFILGISTGTVAVAVYSIALQLCNYYSSLSFAISGVLFPRITKMVSNNVSEKELTDTFIRMGRLQFLILSIVLSGFVVFGKEFIILWAGNGYEIAYYVACIIMIPFTIDLIQNTGISILQAKDKHKFRSVLLIMIAFMNIVLSILFVEYWGIIGVAFATGISRLIENIIMNIYYSKLILINIRKFWMSLFELLIPFILATAMGAFINSLIDQTSVGFFVLKVLIFSLVYVGLIWNFGMNYYEKNIIISLINKIKSLYKRSL
ncbi:oligosaccharide flippase family protein [Bacillus sp. E214]|uniref:oligosaccharide flippase family protein n=1 Tax=Bacillus sp. E214 TaxID=2587156 RepID=UPI0011DF219C|nr:oligosaccharide flippase family protein [Bacillus sp. E214]